MQIVDGPAGLMQAKCVQSDDVGDQAGFVRCYVTRDRYGAFVSDGDITRARQQAAAQYALLVNSE